LQTEVITIGFVMGHMGSTGSTLGAGYLHQPVAWTDCSYNQGN
jgi:hypothetical protein